MKIKELAIYDLVETYAHEIGVIVKISKRGIVLRTFDGDITIHLYKIKRVLYVTPKCLKHKERFCKKCGQLELISNGMH